MNRIIVFTLCFFALAIFASAQPSGNIAPSSLSVESEQTAGCNLTDASSLTDWKELYHRADNFNQHYNAKFYNGVQQLQNISDTHFFWYLTRTPEGKAFFIIDADKRSVMPAFDAIRLADSLSLLTKKEVLASQLPFNSIRFSKEMDTLYVDYGGFDYTCILETYTLSRRESRPRQPRYWGGVSLENSTRKVKSPDKSHEAYILEGNLWTCKTTLTVLNGMK